jgi:hypothetical protein
MKRFILLSAIAMAALFSLATANAQQKINYRVSTYVKIAPDKEAAALEFAKTNGTKLIREMMNSGQTPLTAIALQKVVYTGVPALDYNYIQTSTYNGAPPEPNATALDPVYRKATGMGVQEYGQKLAAIGTVVGTMVYRVEAAVPGSQTAEGNYIQVVRWKITPQRGADYGNYMQKMQLPLNAQAMKDGRNIGWSTARVVYPGGADAPFDSYTATTMKDLAAALPTAPGNPDQGQLSFAKVFPGQNFSAFVDAGRSLRRAVRSDLIRVMWSIDRSSASTSTSAGR